MRRLADITMLHLSSPGVGRGLLPLIQGLLLSHIRRTRYSHVDLLPGQLSQLGQAHSSIACSMQKVVKVVR